LGGTFKEKTLAGTGLGREKKKGTNEEKGGVTGCLGEKRSLRLREKEGGGTGDGKIGRCSPRGETVSTMGKGKNDANEATEHKKKGARAHFD